MTDATTTDATFNPFDPGFRADPYPMYSRILREAPVHRAPLDAGWVFARYADVQTVLRNPHARLGGFMDADQREAVLRAQGLWDQWEGSAVPVFMDTIILLKEAPDHTRIRGLLNTVFTPKAVEALRPHVEQLVVELLADVADRDTFDVVEDLAYPLPALVICELLGVPTADRDRLKGWSAAAARLLDPMTATETFAAAAEALAGFTEYFAELVEERRRSPRDDLLSQLVAAGGLSHDELLSNATFLFAAGHETTQNLIGNGTLALLRNSAELARLHDDPGLVRTAVEEFLRYDPPIQVTGRTAMEDIEVGGTTVRAGERAVLLLAAANRDPAQFDDPERLDIDRADVRPLSFGGGIHFCLGAALARMEAQVAFAALVPRLPSLELAGEPVRRESFTLRGLSSLPLRSVS